MDNTTQTKPALTPVQKRAATLARKKEHAAARARAMGCSCTMCDVPVDHLSARDAGLRLRTFTFGIIHTDGSHGDELDVLATDSTGACSHANDIAQEVYENVARLQPLSTGGSGGWITVFS